MRGDRSERHDDHFAGAGLLLQSQRLFDGELVVRIEDELDARLVDRLAIGGDLHARFRVWHALDTHGYFHKRRRYDATFYVASGETQVGAGKQT